MSWKAEYALLIFLSTVVDYFCAIQMDKQENKKNRRIFLIISLFVNLGMLAGFKYLGFISDSLSALLNMVDLEFTGLSYQILLPVGISFYTFQTLSYTIDVYKGRQKPEKHFGIFAVYVSFFPQLVAGPIERSTNLLPQFHRVNQFVERNVTSGLRQMLVGFFKKIVIADNLAVIVDFIYNDPTNSSGISLLLATVFFAFQIYADFSGYSDIAIGTARIMGYDLMQNFRQPYRSKSISEFWKRWHISLSTWFRDYVYIPLGGNRVSKLKWYLNLFITFTISGLWHGANWTFVFWGALNGVYLIVESLFSRNVTKLFSFLRISEHTLFKKMLGVVYVFILINISWIFFRAENISQAFLIVNKIYNESFIFICDLLYSIFFGLDFSSINELILSTNTSVKNFNIIIISLILLEIYHYYESKYNIDELLNSRPSWIRWFLYYFTIGYIYLFGNFNSSQFIYFQF